MSIPRSLFEQIKNVTLAADVIFCHSVERNQIGLTQFYFRTTQKCKRYLKVAFKYLVLFRRRNVSLVPFGAILTLPPPPWEFATAISAEEGPAPTTSSAVSHPQCTYDSTCKRSDENSMNTSRVLVISLRNSIGELPPGKISAAVWRKLATAQSQAFTPA